MEVNGTLREGLGEAYIKIITGLGTPGLFVGIDTTQEVILTDTLCDQLPDNMSP
jgi:hypothetical protein